jgi:cyclophilin family peptidyl-prolyl cis-trans isomerase
VTLEPGRLGIEIAQKTGRVLEVGDGAAKDAGVGQGWTFVEVEGYEFDVNTLASYSQGDRSYEVVLATPRPNPTAVFDTNYGTIKAEIWLDRTPITASNFIDLAKMGFYDDLHIHRIISGFMAQFGCPYSRELPAMAAGEIEANKLGSGGPDMSLRSFVNLVNGQSIPRSGGNIPDEFSSEDSNAPGTLSMANAGPNSGGSQFFFNVGQNSQLDWFSEGQSKHPVFGQVTEGYDVVEKITQAKAYPTEIPVDLIKVSKVTIEGL